MKACRLVLILPLAFCACDAGSTGCPRPANFRDVAPLSNDWPRVEWLSRNAVTIRSIDPEDDDFADLMPLKKLIVDSCIVQLGEQSHGDGATFYAKQRLIRFLHEEMGFNVLAWDSGFFDCEEMDKALHTDMPVREALSQGIFPIWGRGALVVRVFDYARATHKTNRPLRMAGVDIQFSGNAGKSYAPRLFEFLDRFDPQLASTGDQKTIKELVRALQKEEYESSKAEREKCRAVIDKLLQGLKRTGLAKSQHLDISFVRRTLKNLAAFEEQQSRRVGMPPAVSTSNFRDEKMAENLLWLANERYPNEKIIVWAASSHILRNPTAIKRRKQTLAYKVTMGHLPHRELGARLYTVGFTAFQGEVGNPSRKPRNLPPPAPDSLETLLHATGKPYLFLDLRGLPKDHWLRTPIVSQPLGYVPMLSNWPDNFDAIFYTDVMFPNTQAGDVPQGVKTKGR